MGICLAILDRLLAQNRRRDERPESKAAPCRLHLPFRHPYEPPECSGNCGYMAPGTNRMLEDVGARAAWAFGLSTSGGEDLAHRRAQD